MITIPNEVVALINDPKSSKTISTSTKGGRIHTIYMGSMMAISSDHLAFAHILMKRTNQNLGEMKEGGEPVSVSITLGQASYEIIAKVESYQTSGPAYNRIVEELERSGVKEGLDRYGMKVHGVWVLEPIEVWNESPGPSAGTRVV
jgi:hypothetical protein